MIMVSYLDHNRDAEAMNPCSTFSSQRRAHDPVHPGPARSRPWAQQGWPGTSLDRAGPAPAGGASFRFPGRAGRAAL